ncbi:hypothetical protein LXL04_036320 [Taraxacum kok-saghyz]
MSHRDITPLKQPHKNFLRELASDKQMIGVLRLCHAKPTPSVYNVNASNNKLINCSNPIQTGPPHETRNFERNQVKPHGGICARIQRSVVDKGTQLANLKNAISGQLESPRIRLICTRESFQ